MAGGATDADRPCSGVYLMALSIRLSTICRTASSSARTSVSSLDVARLERQAQVLGLGAAAVGLDARLQHRDQAKRPVVEDLLAPLEPGQAEQVEDQLVESLDLLVDSLEESDVDRLVVEGPIEQGLGVGLDRGQGRLELVGGVGDEVLPHPLEPAQLGHVVEDEHGPRRRTTGQGGAADGEGSVETASGRFAAGQVSSAW